MAISVDWENKIINVPKADTQLVQSSPQEIRRLDIDAFRLALKDLEDDQDGMTYLDTHRHNTTVEISGVILARVIEIINGYTVTFEDGQYAVNLVGANSNIADVTNVNQVSVRPNNSAGLQDLSSLQAASFQGVIAIDVNNGVPGTLFPIGTEGQPVSNLTDALAISQQRGIKTFKLFSNLTIDQAVHNSHFLSAVTHTSVTVNLNGQDLQNCLFGHVVLTGSLGAGPIDFYDGKLQSGTDLYGGLSRVGLGGNNSIADSQELTAVDCYSDVVGSATSYLSFGTSSALELRRYAGGLEVENFDATNTASIDVSQGHIVLAATCTAGSITTRGNGYYTRNDGGAVTLIEDGLINKQVVADQTHAQGKLANPIVLRNGEEFDVEVPP